LTDKTRFINNDTIAIFQQLLENETWECIYVHDDINGIFNTFLNIFWNIFEASFPVKCTNFNIIKNGWITIGIKISCRCKRTLCILSRSCSHLRLKTYYTGYCSILRKVIRETKKQCYSRLLASSDNRIKTIWNIIKNETRKVCTSEHMPPIFIHYDTVVKPEKAAEAVNNFFKYN
jgi:hypothetical protein